MNNTMPALAQRNSLDLPQTNDIWQPRVPVTPPTTAGKRSKRTKNAAAERMTVLVMLVCMFAVCSIGVVYIAAFARIAWQAQQVQKIDSELSAASGRHEALLKDLTILQSDHRIAPLAAKISMSQGGSIPFVDVMPVQSSTPREVASAL